MAGCRIVNLSGHYSFTCCSQPGWYRSVAEFYMYYIVYGFFYLVSLLPFFILYGIADIGFVVTYYLIGYRRDVVMENLRLAFPDKPETELQLISKRFFRNFIDNWVETIKLLSISKRSLQKRITGNFEVFNELYSSGRSVQANLGHFFNWEIMTLYAGICQPYTFLTVYLPQSSKIFDRLLITIRGRWGNPLLASTEIARALIPWRKKQYLLALGADQSPATGESGYWLYFMNRPAIFPKGPEKFARSQNLPVIMLRTTRPKRGYYDFHFFLLSDDPKSLPDGELIRQYVKHLEENLYLQPDLYLWSHKRWKHPWKPEYKHLWVDTKPAPGENN